jgi:hypothetical protein
MIPTTMYRKTSKFRRRTELTLVYSIMTLSVVLLVAVLVLVMQGYRFNKFDGKVEQGGLLQYNSQPTGGTVFLNDVKLGNQTPNKITVSAGSHAVKMTKTGYVAWKKNVTVEPGGILWLNYTRFIPEKREVKPVIEFANLSDAVISPDRKLALVKDVPSTLEATLVTLDTDSPEQTKIAFDPALIATADDPASRRFSFDSWDLNNRYVLTKYTYDVDKVQWLVVDVRDRKVANNLTSELGVNVKDVQFVLGNNRALYVLNNDNELRRVELGSKTLSGPLLSNVTEFNQFDRNTVVYTTGIDDTTKKRSVGYLTNGASKSRVLQSFADNGTAPLMASIGRYFNENYVAIAYGETVSLAMGDLPASDSNAGSALKQVATISLPGGVTHLDFSPGENRHLYAQNATSLVNYDIELASSSSTMFKDAQPKEVAWLDRYHFANTAGARVMLYEFDGQNPIEMATNTVDLPVSFSANDRYFYLFTSGDKPALSRIDLEI